MPVTPPRRTYRSPLRQQQAAATRELILKALAEQLASDGLQDFVLADAAKRAGVSARTIYRYFPNREALLEAVAEWVDRQFSDLPRPTSLPDVLRLVREGFPAYDRQADLVRALLVTKLGKNVRSHLLKQRWTLAEVFQPLYDKAPTPELGYARCAAIQHLVLAETWYHLREAFGLSGEQSGEAVAWAIQALVDALDRDASADELRPDG